jgi:hypothetical protein
MLLKKQSLEVCIPRVFVDPVGCLGHPQVYGIHNSWIALGVVFLHSLSKNFNTKLSPISFLG